jgi:large subunit ribosomal protein L35
LPKMKTHSGAKRRFRRTGTGKVVRRKANLSHIRLKKKGPRKRRLSLMDEVSKTDLPRVEKLIGHKK